MLVNSIMDGMNLVAKEGPVVNKRGGVLVLSRTAGAFQQLGKFSLPITSTDVGDTAEALYLALTMPRYERHALAVQARHTVEIQDLHVWLQHQINDINDLLDRLQARIVPQKTMYSMAAGAAGGKKNTKKQGARPPWCLRFLSS